MFWHAQGPSRAWVRVVAVLLLGAIAGCGSGGPSYLEKEKAIREVPIGSLKGRGAKFVLRQYEYGYSAWAIDLRGMTITDDMLEELKTVGHLTELNFSKSTITDQQLTLVNQRPTSGFLLQLDLSKTGITDAGLDSLNNLVLIQTLNLSETKVTPAGIARFKKTRADDPKIPQVYKNPKIVTSGS